MTGPADSAGGPVPGVRLCCGQAIVVKFIGPTNTRGSRYKATCQAGSVTVRADDRLSIEGNAEAACLALVFKFGWTRRRWVGGGLPDGRYVFLGVDS